MKDRFELDANGEHAWLAFLNFDRLDWIPLVTIRGAAHFVVSGRRAILYFEPIRPEGVNLDVSMYDLPLHKLKCTGGMYLSSSEVAALKRQIKKEAKK